MTAAEIAQMAHKIYSVEGECSLSYLLVRFEGISLMTLNRELERLGLLGVLEGECNDQRIRITRLQREGNETPTPAP